MYKVLYTAGMGEAISFFLQRVLAFLLVVGKLFQFFFHALIPVALRGKRLFSGGSAYRYGVTTNIKTQVLSLRVKNWNTILDCTGIQYFEGKGLL